MTTLRVTLGIDAAFQQDGTRNFLRERAYLFWLGISKFTNFACGNLPLMVFPSPSERERASELEVIMKQTPHEHVELRKLNLVS